MEGRSALDLGDSQQQQEGVAKGNRPLVLIVEDEPAIAVLFKTLLHMEGFEPTVATSTKAAIAFLEKSKPHVVVLDVMMPGESGLRVCRHIRKRPELREIPVIIVSARTQESDVEAGYQAGADAYLEKPISNRQLIDAVRQHVAGACRGQQPADRPLPVELAIEPAVLENES